MIPRRRIAVVTGSRAEYGLLYWLLKEIENHSDLDLQLIVTGAHLSPRFGYTRDEIAADGFPIAAEIDVDFHDDTRVAVATATGKITAGISNALARLSPGIIVVLGDRFEMLAAASAGLLMGVPIAHIHGGEETEGAIDNSIRHAITKMATFHFAAAEPYARRILAMGEDPRNVFVVGAMAAESIVRRTPTTRAMFEKSCGIELGEQFMLVTYHPETARLDADADAKSVRALVQALDRFPKATIVFTGTNMDPGHAPIVNTLRTFVAAEPTRRHWFDSLGRERYLNGVGLADVVIGNSSSGIIEAPLLGTPTVNIGTRQAGRLRAPSIIDCQASAQDIHSAILRALSPEFRGIAAERQSPYGNGDASIRIARILREALLPPPAKRFHDRGAEKAA